MLKLSFEDQISRYIELYCWNYTCDELQEYEQGKVRAHHLTILPHCIGHCFQHIRMLAWMQSWHHCIFHEWELLDG